jgi:hypothetical protein
MRKMGESRRQGLSQLAGVRRGGPYHRLGELVGPGGQDLGAAQM